MNSNKMRIKKPISMPNKVYSNCLPSPSPSPSPPPTQTIFDSPVNTRPNHKSSFHLSLEIMSIEDVSQTPTASKNTCFSPLTNSKLNEGIQGKKIINTLFIDD